MSASRPLRVAVIAGEESGDLLGADLCRALEASSGGPIELFGVGGRHLATLGLDTMFDPSAIALMGATAVIKDLPRLLVRISTTAKAIVAAKPDCLITIDSPEFTLRVAKKVRARNPDIPIIHYVCPSVWAWRPERAPAMRACVDHVLCILPFEAAALKRLDGPPGTYVGHRLVYEPGVLHAARHQANRRKPSPVEDKTLLVLPGSRRSEVSGLIKTFGETVDILYERGRTLRVLIPTVPHVAEMVEKATAKWPAAPEIILDPARKWQAFGEADAALAASGTVSLELALCRVPLVSCYRSDRLMRLMTHLITTWSGALPNLIADRALVPEYYDTTIRPGLLARQMEQLMTPDSDARMLQLNGFADVARRMATKRRPGTAAAEIVLRYIRGRGKPSTDRWTPPPSPGQQ
ncbi:lipid-A-disaccharide synthase [Mesorhizobium sp. NBSH29]|uniref:lipid-A-disaccharide synthase n=1 Tax=Mesorhizobium sp. NBSH29 TaxID=2654249 RepID=UPI0018968384|nr:lipid-A-disaccharide synthase [Mesorhizobium sp. NBSH29]QPC87695.1 lipid-A-disaccharide synthase [Mesorhizobium sp. NBSH29]